VIDLPGGTVTFLFTDVEGSTRLAQELPHEWPAVHAEHRRVLRETMGGHGGREVDTQGDSFLFAFARAHDAVAAAAAAQRAVAAHSWPHGSELRVRMGLHTGEPHVGDEGYLGVDLARTARICAAAHGGQVLLSSATRGLVDEDTLEGVAIIDRGEHRLKDLRRPERLYQLVLAGAQSDLRPLRTEATQERAPALPVAATGRDVERFAERAFRDLRATVEESIAVGLRSAHEAREQALRSAAEQRAGSQPPRPPRPRRPSQASSPAHSKWVVVFLPIAITAMLVSVPVIWLLTR
jgi:class 3 adenylate cyclase